MAGLLLVKVVLSHMEQMYQEQYGGYNMPTCLPILKHPQYLI
jgi:hypothetical protein